MSRQPVPITKVRVIDRPNACPSGQSKEGAQPEGEEATAATPSIKELLLFAPARSELLVLRRGEARRRGVAPDQ